MSAVLFEQEFGGFRGDLSHLGDEGAVASVVVDAFLVEPGLILGEPTIDGFAIDFRGPLPVGAMHLGRVAVAAAASVATAVVPQGEAVSCDVSDVGDLGCEFLVAALVVG